MRILSFIGGLLLLVFFWFWERPEPLIVKINGVSLESPPKPIDSARFATVTRVNPGYVAIIPYAFSYASQPEVHYSHDHRWWGESYAGAAKLIEMSKAQDLQVMLKPHVWISKEGWPGDYQLSTEKDWLIWEETYAEYILGFAQLADSLSVEIFCIGTEYRHAARQRGEFWTELIAEVRQVYDGQVTYAANWDNYQNISFWGDLDYVGIDAYWPLDDAKVPVKSELIESWQPVVDELEAFAEETDKPILFTEYGYRSVSHAAGPHWELDDQPYLSEGQDIAYQAIFESLWDKPWFAGGFLWKWRFWSNVGGEGDRGYTPQGKPAETTISTFYRAGE